MKPAPALVWSTATLMVTIVSCCSLIGVSIMPLISGPSYKIFITLFTGLAVGSLLGSAIFSLIPQAFALHQYQADKSYLWKSLIIFLGIYLFYCSERIMRIYFDRKAKKREQQERQLQLKNNKSNTEIPAEASGDTTEYSDVPNQPGSALTNQNSNDNNLPGTNSTSERDHDNQDCLNHLTIENRSQLEPLQHHHHHHNHGDAFKPQEIITKALKGDSPGRTAKMLRRNEIAPVAWMIIIGDGLHNFIDGLSIGAAFSDSISLGVTTSVAVIFEEFPHELGDFAVLISSGMTVRQAVGFNFLSACTCYLGMIFGILLGDLTQSASFIFALAGGMFLYISLVDMMGELSAMLEESKGSTREVSHLLVMQNIGILTGIIITFTLSLYSNG